MSKDPERISRILLLVQKLWEANPDWRFDQLVSKVHPAGGLAFNTDDDTWEQMLRERLESKRPSF